MSERHLRQALAAKRFQNDVLSVNEITTLLDHGMSHAQIKHKEGSMFVRERGAIHGLEPLVERLRDDELKNAVKLRELALDMGRVIRALDESGEHSEFWTQDGDYIIDGRFPR